MSPGMSRPIIFSAPMVRAILDGKKTQTRRIVKAGPIAAGIGWSMWYDRKLDCQLNDRQFATMRCPHGTIGDRLWVRETWMEDPPDDGTWEYVQYAGCPNDSRLSDIPERFRASQHVIHKASWTGSELRWRSPIHMPRWASRLTLEITEARVQRLQDISEEDAKAEGCAVTCGGCGNDVNDEEQAEAHWPCDGQDDADASARYGFRRAWNAINGKRAPWESNPWVWAITFRMVMS